MTRRFLYMLIPVFATTVYSYCLFAILSFMGTDVTASYHFGVAFLCALMATVVNYRFLLRERSVVSVAALNAVLIILTAFFGFSAPNDIEGFWLYLIAGVCFSAPVLHGFALCRNAMKIGTMILFCEFSIVGTVVLMTMQLGEMAACPLANGLSVTALILNLFMLSVLRISGPAKKPEGGRKGRERGTLLITGLMTLIFAAVGIAVFLLPASRGAIISAVYATRDFFILIGQEVERFLTYLASLIPVRQMEAIDPGMADVADISGAELAALEEMNSGIMIWGVIALAALALAAAVFFLIRYRRKKMSGHKAVALVYVEDDEWQPAFQGLSALLKRIKDAITLWQCCVKRRDTYEEAFLRIQRYAKRRGIRRRDCETPKAFLHRVARDLSYESGSLDQADRAGHYGTFLAAVSTAVDKRLYSGKNTGFTPLTAGDAKTLPLFIAAIGKRHLSSRKR